MSVPGSSDCLVKPRRKRTFGVPASIAQLVIDPSGFFTSTCSQVCWLIHSILLILPLKFTGLLASNSAAKAWCAEAEVAKAESDRAVAQAAIRSLFSMESLLNIWNALGSGG